MKKLLLFVVIALVSSFGAKASDLEFAQVQGPVKTVSFIMYDCGCGDAMRSNRYYFDFDYSGKLVKVSNAYNDGEILRNSAGRIVCIDFAPNEDVMPEVIIFTYDSNGNLESCKYINTDAEEFTRKKFTFSDFDGFIPASATVDRNGRIGLSDDGDYSYDCTNYIRYVDTDEQNWTLAMWRETVDDSDVCSQLQFIVVREIEYYQK